LYERGGYAPFFILFIMDNNFKFLYWDDLGDSQHHVDNQKTACSNHNRQLEEDLLEERLKNAEWAEMEEELNKRMDIIGQNGNTGEHYEDTNDDIN
jgi:hypothetical protein